MTAGFPRIAAMGVTGVLVSFADRLSEPANRAALAFRARVEEAALPGVAEVAVTLASVFLRIDPATASADKLTPALEKLLGERDWTAAPLPPGRTLWRIPTVFGGDDGPQLGDAAALAGTSEEAAVAILTANPLRVLALGFSPGMPYLGTLPDAWDLPRQTDLTPRVQPGAVVVAVRQIVLFGTSAPTGWRQVGRCSFRCFEPSRPQPIALRPGDEVQFVESDAATVDATDPQRHGNARAEELA